MLVQHRVNDSMALVEFAECNRSSTKLAEYAVYMVQVQLIKGEPGALVCLIIVEGALWLYKQILELKDCAKRRC